MTRSAEAVDENSSVESTWRDDRFDEMQDAPMVSVIIPAYRAANFIAAAVDSVLAQTYTDFEIIVVNDGSPDTVELERALEAFGSRIRYIKQPNRGCSAARNAAIRCARGQLLAFLDADDYWEQQYLSEQVGFLEKNPAVDLVYTDGLLVGDSLLAGRTFMQATPSRGQPTLQALLTAKCTVLLSGTLVRKSAVLDVDLFDEDLRCSEDYDLWLRLGIAGKRLAYQRKVLLSKRIHAGNLSADRVNLHEHALLVLRKTSLDPGLGEQDLRALHLLEERLKAAIKLEVGKQKLSARDFEAAASYIRQANAINRSWKLRLMLLWLRYVPTGLMRLYNLRSKLSNEQPPSEKGTTFTVRALWLFSAKCFAFALSFMLPLLLVRRLSQHEFGLYKQVFLIVGTALYILPLGFGMSAFYFLPRERERRNHVVFNVLLFYLIMGSWACIALFLRPSLLTSIFNSPELSVYAPRIGLVILFWVVSSFLELAAIANEETRLATLFIIFSQIAKTVLMIGATIWVASVSSLINAAIVFGILQTAVLLLYLRSRFDGFWQTIDWRMIRTQFAYALPIGFGAVLFQVQTDLHNYFVSHQFSAADFAIYSIGCFNLPLIAILSESAGSVTIPHVSYLQKDGRDREIIELIARMIRKLAAIYFPIYLFLLVMAHQFITFLFTTRYESSWPIFVINLTMIPLGLVASACDPVMRAYAEHRYFIIRVRTFIIAGLATALWFASRNFGLLGPITIVVGFSLIERTLIAAKVGRILGVTRQDAGLLKDVGKVIAATLAAGGGALAVRLYWPDASPLTLLVACGIVFCLIYASGLALLDVLTPNEREFIKGRLARLPRFPWRPAAVPAGGAGLMSLGYPEWQATAPAVYSHAPAAAVSPILTRSASIAIALGELTQKQHWDATHTDETEFWRRKQDSAAPARGIRVVKNSVKKLLGPRFLEHMGSYEEYILWNVIYEKYMPRKEGAKALEVGSAPGDFLVRLSETFKFVPYGVEYSESGVDLNRQIFAEHDISTENVIHGDFFSDEFHQRYKGRFDIVVSRGFIEHFTDAKAVVQKHADLLAPGGTLIISIPNLIGFNYLLAHAFNKDVIAIHNLDIMRKPVFRSLFDESQFDPQFCDYYGTFNFGLFNVGDNSLLRALLSVCMKIQVVLNITFRLLFGRAGAESRFFSPALIFIGVKKESTPDTPPAC